MDIIITHLLIYTFSKFCPDFGSNDFWDSGYEVPHRTVRLATESNSNIRNTQLYIYCENIKRLVIKENRIEININSHDSLGRSESLPVACAQNPRSFASVIFYCKLCLI